MVLHDSVLYVSAGSLYALRASDGRLIWQTPLGAGGRGALEFALQFARGVLYLAANGVVSAVSARDGTLLWHTQVCDGLHTMLVDGADGTNARIYVGSGGLTALHAGEGSELWHVGVQGSGIFSLQLAGGTLCAGTTDNRALTIDPADGRLRWGYQGSMVQVLSRPAIVGATFYLAAHASTPISGATGVIGMQTVETIVALRASDGAVVWRHQLVLGMPTSAVARAGDPVVSGGDGAMVYAAAGPTGGDVIALATTNGAVQFQRPSDDTVQRCWARLEVGCP